MSKLVFAHDMEADDGRRWFVFDTDKAEAVGETWAEVAEIKRQIEEKRQSIKTDRTGA